jgi:hypothetical protein
MPNYCTSKNFLANLLPGEDSHVNRILEGVGDVGFPIQVLFGSVWKIHRTEMKHGRCFINIGIHGHSEVVSPDDPIVKVGKKKSVRGRHIPFAIGSIVVLIGYHG